MKKICAIVVTYNRLELLKLTIEKLLKQARKIDEIIVINNASTDGTQEFLEEIKDQVTVESLSENLGGAGGFSAGIKCAYEKGYDYFWIMDDDTIVKEDSLEMLEAGLERFSDKKIGFLASNVLFKDDKPCIMNVPHLYKEEWNEYAGEGYLRLNAASFVSVLVSREAVKEVGLPIKEFFIWGDDIEFTERISSKFECYFVAKSIVYHYMNENKGVDLINECPARVNRHFYDIRNKFYVAKSRGGKTLFGYFKYVAKLTLNIIFKAKEGRGKKLKVVVKGFFKGIMFNPSIQYIDKK